MSCPEIGTRLFLQAFRPVSPTALDDAEKMQVFPNLVEVWIRMPTIKLTTPAILHSLRCLLSQSGKKKWGRGGGILIYGVARDFGILGNPQTPQTPQTILQTLTVELRSMAAQLADACARNEALEDAASTARDAAAALQAASETATAELKGEL